MKYLLIISCLLFTSVGWSKDVSGDYEKYAICYGEMTKFHKRTKLHQTNRPLSIDIKERVCECYSKGEIDEYIGMVGCPTGSNLKKRSVEKDDKLKSEQLETETNYKDNKLEGEQLSYFESGQVKVKSHYKNGKLEGEFLKYYENGQLETKTNYKDNKLEGKYFCN